MTDEFGYAGKILNVDLSSGEMAEIPTARYAERFVGGRGIAAGIFWDETPPGAGALDPENRLIFITGPLCGLPGLSGSRSQVCGRAADADSEHYWCGNMGGSWGAYLKFAGYDGIVVHGRSPRPVYLTIADGVPQLRDASAIWGRDAVEVRSLLKSALGDSARVLSTGTAGDNLAVMATVMADADSSASGFGAVMGSKRLKAIVVPGEGGRRPRVAHPDRLRQLTGYVRALNLGKSMRFFNWPQWPLPDQRRKQQICYGCICGCHRQTYTAADGDTGKFFCQSATGMYYRRALRYYGEPGEVPFKAARLCDRYGLETKAIEVMIEWLVRCHRAGILTDESTGIPISRAGSLEFFEALVKKIALREGFGDVLAGGVRRAADEVGGGARELLSGYASRNGQTSVYGAREYISTGLFYATEPRQPISLLHAVTRPVIKWTNWLSGKSARAYMSGDMVRAIAGRFWGSQIAADFSTYEGKALAAKEIQDRIYAIDCLILCDKYWPIWDIEGSEDHMGDPAAESRLYSAVTGHEADEQQFLGIGERVFNLHRAILAREGHRGIADDCLPEGEYTVPIQTGNLNPECLVPGKDGVALSRKGAVVDREQFARMRAEYYQLRGWDAGGRQTKSRLRQLGLEDIARGLEQGGLTLPD